MTTSSSLSRLHQNQGAIPKTRTKPNNVEPGNSRYQAHEMKSGKMKARINANQDEFDTCVFIGSSVMDFSPVQKQKNERENGIIDWIIDEEDGPILRVTELRTFSQIM